MPIKYTTLTEEQYKFYDNFVEKIENEDMEFEEEEFSRIVELMKTIVADHKEYQNQRLKINKESRESKMAARKEGGGGAKRVASAKMTGAVKLVPIDLDAGIFTIEKVSVPAAPAPAAPAPAPEPVVVEPEREEAVKTKKVQQKKINTARAKATPKLVRKNAPAPAPAVIPKFLQEEHDNDSDATVTDDEE